MSRAKDIIRLLEGFKLGSLGVSHKPHVTLLDPSMEKEPVTIVKKKWMKDITISDSWVDGLRWTESNGYMFFMRCRKDSGSETAFVIEVDGGPKLQVSFDRHFNGDTKHAIIVASHEFSATDEDEAKNVFKGIGQQVLDAGSFGAALALGKLGNGWEADGGLASIVPGFTDAFSSYLLDTSGQRKSSYVIIN
jgi:hypothetical protein